MQARRVHGQHTTEEHASMMNKRKAEACKSNNGIRAIVNDNVTPCSVA